MGQTNRVQSITWPPRKRAAEYVTETQRVSDFKTVRTAQNQSQTASKK